MREEISPETKERMQKYYKDGKGIAEISRELGVDRYDANYICKGFDSQTEFLNRMARAKGYKSFYDYRRHVRKKKREAQKNEDGLLTKLLKGIKNGFEYFYKPKDSISIGEVPGMRRKVTNEINDFIYSHKNLHLNDIADEIEHLYGIKLSPSTISSYKRAHEIGGHSRSDYSKFLSDRNLKRMYLFTQQDQIDSIQAKRMQRKEIAKQFGNTVKRMREELGKTQTQVAKEVGCSKEAISLYEKGEIFPKDDLLNRIYSSLGIEKPESPFPSIYESKRLPHH